MAICFSIGDLATEQVVVKLLNTGFLFDSNLRWLTMHCIGQQSSVWQGVCAALSGFQSLKLILRLRVPAAWQIPGDSKL